tara:strand:- start:528 stop:701 length:174 start_codon:yes stop_codon:yes gene_type:complete
MKTLKSQDVIGLLQRKIELKKELRQARKDGDQSVVTEKATKIKRIEDKLSQSPLSKS